MILQALYEYYQRKASDPSGVMAPDGFDWKEIPFLCNMDQQGNFVGFEDTRQQVGTKRLAKQFLVPVLGEAKGNGIKANLLWENAEYCFGTPTKESSNKERVKLQNQAFIEKIESSLDTSNSQPWKYVIAFLKGIQKGQLEQDPLWSEVVLPTSLILFAMDGIGPLTGHPDVVAGSENSDESEADAQLGYCLISGKKTWVARLLPQIRGVRDANPTGASLVAVNNKIEGNRNQGQTPAFASFMKQQGYNSPIGKKEAGCFGKALNWLLRRDSPNKMQIGDATTVFWSDKRTDFESHYRSFFSGPTKDDPDKGIMELRAAVESIRSGIPPDESSSRFYVLGLAPNAARISVRFWHQGTVGEFAENIRRHFDDLEIVMPSFDKGNLALSYLLSSTALEWKTENVPPNMAGAVMRSIMTGTAYPVTLLQQCLRRIRAEQGDVNRARASILKACLNRRARASHQTNEKEITVALDPTNTNVGYRLGRLFAELEKIQEDASGRELNTTIRDRFYAAASSNPTAVFPQLFKLKNHHLAKLENPAFRVVHEKRLAEIIDGLPTDMPNHLAMEDQARFALGYYHQRQALFTMSKDKENK